jgi:hypothetical protein
MTKPTEGSLFFIFYTMADRDDMVKVLVESWVATIKDAMEAQRAPSVEFTADKDFKMRDVEWMKQTLIPSLSTRGFVCTFLRYALPGDGVGCDCYGSPCEHAKGRVLRVQLKL